MSVNSQDIERKQNFSVNQGPLVWYNCVKMTCNNTKLDPAKINASIEFGEILPIWFSRY